MTDFITEKTDLEKEAELFFLNYEKTVKANGTVKVSVNTSKQLLHFYRELTKLNTFKSNELKKFYEAVIYNDEVITKDREKIRILEERNKNLIKETANIKVPTEGGGEISLIDVPFNNTNVAQQMMDRASKYSSSIIKKY